MAAAAAAEHTRVKFRLRGVRFESTSDVLLKEPGSGFHTLLASPPDEEGEYKIDLDHTFFGVILVYLRKGRFNIRWDELSHAQQQSVADVVQHFHIPSLLKTYGAPTKPAPPPGEETATDAVGNGTHDDEPPLLPTGCPACGMSGHTQDECPHMKR